MIRERPSWTGLPTDAVVAWVASTPSTVIVREVVALVLARELP